MKTTFSILFTLLLIPILTCAQSVDSLSAEIRSLKERDEKIDQQIDSLNSVKNDIRLEILKKSELIKRIKLGNIEDVSGTGIPTGIKSQVAFLKDEPSIKGNTLVRLNADDEVLVYEWFEDPYFKASYEGQLGYISQASLEENEFVKSIRDKIEQVKLDELRKESPRLAELAKKYGEENARGIMNGSIWIGMTKAMAHESIGYPEDINRSRGSWGVHEQWVYPNGKYLYFEDGKLTSWQN